MIHGIRNIIFDLGGVLLNIDYKLTEEAFVTAGVEDFPKMYSQLQQTTLFDDFETGRIPADEFIEGLQKAAGKELSKIAIIDAWNKMLLDFPLRRLQILQQLRTYYDLFLLSNTNELHEAEFNRILKEDHNIIHLAAYFDRIYFSHRIGMRKPDPEVFEMILLENGLEPQETLFIDDSPQHIEGAKKLGIQTIWLTNGMTIEDDIFKPKN